MKRRNAEVGKMRRPMKRNKITEGFYGSTLLYLKFLVLWALVILADFILEFRFEFLWPFYLLLRSVYDSFKYQGLAFSVFFVCIALTSDMLCFFFIPVHWLFFVASTYVWVQYVWHTDKGICAPTIVLWMLFVYLEAAVRLRDVKHMPGLLDLCRPFAAHCIGYPVVTLGFGFKSYVGFRIRQRKQRDVAKENEFYLQLMQQALPVDTSTTTTTATSTPVAAAASATPTNAPAAVASATLQVQESPAAVAATPHPSPATQPAAAATGITSKIGKQQQHERNGHLPNGLPNGVQKSHRKAAAEKASKAEVEHSSRNGSAVGAGAEEAQQSAEVAAVTAAEPAPRQPTSTSRRKEKKEQDRERENAEYLQRLETDTKKLRLDLNSSRASEQELRLQVASLTTTEKVSRGELLAMQRELEDLQSKLQSCNSIKAQDKQTIGNLERRITEERRARTFAESQLQQERKTRKQEEVRAAQVAAQNVRGECTDACRQRRRDLEAEMSNLKTNQGWNEDRITLLERENAALSDQLRDTERLVSALNAMQETNVHLENSLSAETRIKLDLFSALGEAKRQLEIKESCLKAQEKEIKELKSKIAQVLAVMPNDSFGSPTPSSTISRVRLAESPPGSTLDPNATAYTPKGSLVAASTEA